MKWFKGASKPQQLGVEMSQKSVRLLVLQPGTQAEVLNTYHEKFETNPESKDGLSEFIKMHGLKKIPAAFSLPDRLVFSQQLKASRSLKGNLLEQQLLFEVHQQLPYPIESVYYDFQCLSEDDETQNILFVAAKKEDVVSSQTMLSDVGLKAVVADTVQYALIRAVNAGYPEAENVALLYLDDDVVSICITQQGIPVYHNEQRLDGGADVISNKYLMSVVSRLFSWMESSGQDLGDQKLFLLGALANEQLSQDVQLQHQCATQLFQIKNLENAHQWALCYGLALGEVAK